MPLQGDYEPSPWDMIAEQVRLYEQSGGTEGTTLEGQPCVILTTRGRHTGKLRKSPLMRVEHDGTYAVVASMGGAPKSPVWYYNLLANPDEVTVQDGPDVHDLRAREVKGDEKAEWWARAVEVWPSYDQYQASTDRVIPVVVLEPPAG
jgi:F420H(2)-dependent quinone reductase